MTFKSSKNYPDEPMIAPDWYVFWKDGSVKRVQEIKKNNRNNSGSKGRKGASKNFKMGYR